MPVSNPTLERNRKIRREGFDSEKILRQMPARQWWRADGTPLPKLLPVDSYHFDIYTGKGWTLRPPANPMPLDEMAPIEPAGQAMVLAAQGITVVQDNPMGGSDMTTVYEPPPGFKLVPVDAPVEAETLPDFIAEAPPVVTATIATHRHRMNPNENKCHVEGCDHKRQTPYAARKENE